MNFTPVAPADPDDPADRDVVRRVDATSHRLFTDALFRGSYPEDLLADAGPAWPDDLVRDGDVDAISTPFDVLGVNYYASQLIRAGGPVDQPTPHPLAPDAVTAERPELQRSDMGWEITPDALRDLLIDLHREYTGPAGVRLAITENGCAVADPIPVPDGPVIDDQPRIDYLQGHLVAVHQAIEAGVDLDTYLVWTLIDNFEWSFGYAKRFGLVGVDAQLTRHPKASAHWYAELIRSGTLSLPSTP